LYGAPFPTITASPALSTIPPLERDARPPLRRAGRWSVGARLFLPGDSFPLAPLNGYFSAGGALFLVLQVKFFSLASHDGSGLFRCTLKEDNPPPPPLIGVNRICCSVFGNFPPSRLPSRRGKKASLSSAGRGTGRGTTSPLSRFRSPNPALPDLALSFGPVLLGSRF